MFKIKRLGFPGLFFFLLLCHICATQQVRYHFSMLGHLGWS